MSDESIDDALNLMREDMEEYSSQIELLGVGFMAAPGSVANSLTFGGDTYYFGTGDCLPEGAARPTVPTAPTVLTAPTPPQIVETAFL